MKVAQVQPVRKQSKRDRGLTRRWNKLVEAAEFYNLDFRRCTPVHAQLRTTWGAVTSVWIHCDHFRVLNHDLMTTGVDVGNLLKAVDIARNRSL